MAQNGHQNTGEETDRPVTPALIKGALMKCPACGQAPLFNGYLRVADSCPNCQQVLHHHRADDAPPYFTIFIVGHIVVALAMWLEFTYMPPIWLHMALWLPLTILLSLSLLRPLKGAMVGLQWALRMHGFAALKDKQTPS
nr:DUF983 domain-containing protein [Pseudovibrio stylochi]